nr:hypothetical protein [Psychrobacter sp. PraFG1]UNK04448.1 hypothetical protein MN210_08870 [Psychrobacter sp. PraFG1]
MDMIIDHFQKTKEERITAINQDDWYMIYIDDEPLIAEHADSIMRYWQAETIVEFINALNLEKQVSIRHVILFDYNPNL